MSSGWAEPSVQQTLLFFMGGGTAEGDPLKCGASGGPDYLDRRVPLSPGIQPESGPGVAIQAVGLELNSQS